MNGTVIKFDRIKGYGFLVPLDDPTMPDVFVHASDILQTACWKRRFLLPGFNVQFDVEFDENDVDHDKPHARNARVIPPLVIARQTGVRS